MEVQRTTTFTPPHLPSIVARPRLLARLDARPAPKLMLLLGQAAQGKTTLAAAYLKTQLTSVAWIDLDPTAADPANFYYLLVRALDHAGLLGDAARFLDNPVLALGPGEGTARWRARLKELFSRWGSQGLLVIDGLERIPRRSASIALLQTLLDHQPDGLRLLLLSRREPPLKFQHLSVRRQALVITNGELAFTREEIASFFTQVLSNTATTVLIAPLALAAAHNLGIQPQAYMMAVGLAASMAFASPVASPVNTLVMGAGNYRFSDYVRIGTPLLLIGLIISMLVLPLLWPF